MTIRQVSQRFRGRGLALALLGILTTLSPPRMVDAFEPPPSDVLDLALDHGFPGVVVGVVYPDGRSYLTAGGFADLDDERRITPTTMFDLASITKVFTAVVVLRLVERGVVNLDRSLSTILVEEDLEGLRIDGLSLADVMTHRSGLPDFTDSSEYLSRLVGSQFQPGQQYSTADYLREAARLQGERGIAESGTYSYSNTNYLLLGRAVEKLTGKSLESVLAEEITVPLNLTRTFMKGEEPRGVEPASKYVRVSPELRSMVELSSHFRSARDRPELLDVSSVAEYDWASGGLISNGVDLLSFAKALFHGHLLNAESQAWLQAPTKSLERAPVGEERNSVLFAARLPSGVVLAKGGNGPGVHVMMAQDQGSGIVMVAFTNVFGLFDEHEFMLEEMLREMVAADRTETSKR